MQLNKSFLNKFHAESLHSFVNFQRQNYSDETLPNMKQMIKHSQNDKHFKQSALRNKICFKGESEGEGNYPLLDSGFHTS